MTYPVIIAARNEALHIGRALESLPREAEPIVVVNGCTDTTADIAESFGATVLHSEEGKMPAIQEGIRHLGQRAADPFITMDADARVMMPGHWLSAMQRERQRLPESAPAIVFGDMVITSGRSLVRAAIKNTRHQLQNYRTRNFPGRGVFCGANVLIDPHDAYGVEALLALPNLWPCEDVAMKDAILQRGGAVRKSPDPRTAIVREEERTLGILQRLRVGEAGSRAHMRNSYAADAPPGSLPYTSGQLADHSQRI